MNLLQKPHLVRKAGYLIRNPIFCSAQSTLRFLTLNHQCDNSILTDFCSVSHIPFREGWVEIFTLVESNIYDIFPLNNYCKKGFKERNNIFQ